MNCLARRRIHAVAIGVFVVLARTVVLFRRSTFVSLHASRHHDVILPIIIDTVLPSTTKLPQLMDPSAPPPHARSESGSLLRPIVTNAFGSTSFVLPVSFEPPTTTAKNNSIANNMFCVPWSINTDDWWTHHVVLWQIGPENDTHTCFTHRTSKRAIQAFHRLYEIQFGTYDNANRSSTTTTTPPSCRVRKMWSDGFASDIRNVLDGLLEAKRTGIPFTYDVTPWHYAALQDSSNPVCQPMTMACYFLNLSACPNMHQEVVERMELSDPPPSFVRHSYAVEFIVRPRQWLRQRVYHYSDPIRQQLQLAMNAASNASSLTTSTQQSNSIGNRSCTVVHVRRGDVILGGSHTSKRKYYPLSLYLQHVKTSTIVLLTDDANVIDETANYPNFTWVYFNRTRYRGSEGGWEEHMPSRDPAHEVVVLLSTFQLIQLCDHLVHTASNFGQYLFFTMKSTNPTVRRVNLG